ncbi:MAG: hypothetical protein PHW04_00230 [Candidatus Wallbacteria bacterium]|nr:hypothetical protein [Candidatus Wallbacteria bacterium]
MKMLLFVFFSSIFMAVADEKAVPQLMVKYWVKEYRVFDLVISKDESRFYFATDGGIHFYQDGKLRRVYSKSDGLLSETVTFLESTGDSILGSTFSLDGKSGLIRLSSSEELKVWQEKDGAPRNVVRALQLSQDLLLCETFKDGLYLFNLDRNSTMPILQEKFGGKYLVDVILQQNKIYLASKYDGAFEISGGGELVSSLINATTTEVFTQTLHIKEINEHTSKIQSNNVTCFASVENALWIGTQGGASYFKFSENDWKNYWDSLVNNFVSAICVDGDFIWFGTPGGFSVFNKAKDKWWAFRTDSGMSSIRALRGSDAKNDSAQYNNCIMKIKSSKNYIWLSTEQGAVQIDRKQFYSLL